MWRLLVIVALITYIIYKIGSWFFKAGAASQQLRNQQQGGSFNKPGVDPVKDKQKGSGFKGGEYVDYEEVK